MLRRGLGAGGLALTLRRLIFPALPVLAALAGFMLYFNWRTTGQALRMPYQVHEQTYAVVPLFLFQDLKPTRPIWRHEVMRRFHQRYETKQFRYKRSAEGFRHILTSRLPVIAQHYFPPPAYAWPLIALPLVLIRHRRAWIAVGAALIVLVATLAISWLQPHYLAPAFGAALILVVLSVRWLHAARHRRWRWGRAVVRLLLLLTATIWPATMLFPNPPPPPNWSHQRAALAQWLEQRGGRHLVFVRYGPIHRPHQEWVYNGADIDQAPVVWAREMEEAQNRKLIAYYATDKRRRTPWLLTINAGRFVLAPFDQPDAIAWSNTAMPGAVGEGREDAKE